MTVAAVVDIEVAELVPADPEKNEQIPRRKNFVNKRCRFVGLLGGKLVLFATLPPTTTLLLLFANCCWARFFVDVVVDDPLPLSFAELAEVAVVVIANDFVVML